MLPNMRDGKELYDVSSLRVEEVAKYHPARIFAYLLGTDVRRLVFTVIVPDDGSASTRIGDVAHKTYTRLFYPTKI